MSHNSTPGSLAAAFIEGTTVISMNPTLVSFIPDNPLPGKHEGFRRRGHGQMLSDGSFEFVGSPARKRRRHYWRMHLPHGTITHTESGNLHLSLTFRPESGSACFLHDAIIDEANEAALALYHYLK